MRRVVLVAPGELRLEEVEAPSPGPGEATVLVEAAGICGSDLHGYRGVNDRRRPGTVMGHEVSGTVEHVGPGVDQIWVGRAVTVNPILGCDACDACLAGQPQRCPTKVLIGCVPEQPGGFAQVLLAPVSSLVAWPGPAPLRWGAFAEPLAVGVQVIRGLDLTNTPVLVIGSGAIGIANALAARRSGCRVTITDRDDRRAAVLSGLGLTPLAADDVPASASYDVVVDCVASDESVELALRHTHIAGRVVVVGLASARASISIERLVQGDLMLQGSAQYSRSSYADAVAWLASGQLDASDLLSAPEPMSRAPELFRSWTDDSARPVRTLLAPD